MREKRKGGEKEKERGKKRRKKVPIWNSTRDLLVCSPQHYHLATTSGFNCTYHIFTNLNFHALIVAALAPPKLPH